MGARRATRLFEPTSARWNQGNYYTDNPLHGLWKWEDNRVMSSSWFLTGKYAYYNTGFTLNSIGPATDQMGISAILGQTFGSTNGNYFNRVRSTPSTSTATTSRRWATRRTTSSSASAGAARTSSRRRSTRATVSSPTRTRATDFRGRVYREGAGTNRAEYCNLYFGDTIALDRLTLDLGVRYDRQGGKALPSQTAANAAFPNLVPGISFEGYEAPFTWNDFTPRVGMTYALDEARKTIVRASFSRNAGQLTQVGVYIGYANPSSAAGWAEYPWVDPNGDHLAQTNEVLVNQPLLASGGGFNTANPTAVARPT